MTKLCSSMRRTYLEQCCDMNITLERILSLIPKKPDGGFVHGAKVEFAKSIGYSDGHIVAMWENGSSNSYLKKLHEIAAKYNVSVAWLRGETDEKSPPREKGGDELPEITLIARAGKRMSKDQRELMLKWAKLTFPDAFPEDGE